MTDEPKPKPITVSIAEAAEILGVHEDTITNWIKLGILRASKPARRVLIRLDDIEAMLAKNLTNKDDEEAA
jgi:excisionase family DNA binding protein